MAVEPRGGCDLRDGHGLEEELEGLVKAWRHMLHDHAGDSVWSRCFVIRGSPESLLHDDRVDAARHYRDCVLMVGRNAKVPWERCSVWECGVRRKGMGLKFLDLRNYSAGSTRRRPEASSLRIQRSVRRGWVFCSSAAVRRMDCKAIFGFF